MSLQDNIAGVLPYLNAWLQNTEYDHDVGVLLWDDGERKYAFRAYEIDIAPVIDREEAQRTADNVIGIVNDVWNRRHEIEPNMEGRKPLPNLLVIYKLLPGTNCKECGYLTCMAYAADLREGKAELAQCVCLSEPAHTEDRVTLSGILSGEGA
jgi:ArsR family metal-binding transcriptional regulator